jgi:hypothetical protein
MGRKGHSVEFRRRLSLLPPAGRLSTSRALRHQLAVALSVVAAGPHRQGLEPRLRRRRQPSSQRPSGASCSLRPSLRLAIWSC